MLPIYFKHSNLTSFQRQVTPSPFSSICIISTNANSKTEAPNITIGSSECTRGTYANTQGTSLGHPQETQLRLNWNRRGTAQKTSFRSWGNPSWKLTSEGKTRTSATLNLHQTLPLERPISAPPLGEAGGLSWKTHKLLTLKHKLPPRHLSLYLLLHAQSLPLALRGRVVPLEKNQNLRKFTLIQVLVQSPL